MTKFSKDNQPERRGDQSEAGKASGKSRLLSNALEVALKREVEDDKGNKIMQAHKIANAMAKKAGEGDVQAFNAVADRTEGKAAQAIELTGSDGGPVIFNTIYEDKPK